MKVTQGTPIPVTKSDLTHHWQERLNGHNLTEITMKYKDADYFMENDPNKDPEEVIYEAFYKESTPEEGHLTWGHITLYPGKVNDQYHCTKGHYHLNPHAEEYFLCMKGEGLIMFMNREGDCWCEELEEGSLHKVPEGTARRLINLGDDELMLSTCVSSDAGFDFESVTKKPFSCHVYEDDGEMAIKVDVDENAADGGEDGLSDIEALLKI